MSSSKKKYCLLLLFLFTIIWKNNRLHCQNQSLIFNQSSLDKVIQEIETQTPYIFNYNPDDLAKYNFTGQFTNDNIDEIVESILSESPYTFEKNNKTIIVYEEPPKNYRICGFVVDSFSNEALIACNIIALNTNVGSQTNAEGYFDFDIVSQKNQKIEIRYIGYKSKTFTVSNQEKNECPIYALQIDPDVLGSEIVISDYILSGVTQGDPFGAFNLNYADIAQQHSSVEYDILKTLQVLPGVQSIDDSATGLQIRGSTPDQNLVMWEGVPLYNTGHIFGMISAINPFSIRDVTLYKGAYNPRFDHRVGGVVDISLSDSITNSFNGSIGSTLTEMHAKADIPIIKDKSKIELAGRHSFGSIYQSDALKSYTDKVFQFSLIDDQRSYPDLDLLNTEQSLNYYDFHSKWMFKPSENITFSIGGYTNNQDFSYSYSFDNDPFLSNDKITLNTRIFNIDSKFKLTDNWLSSASFYSSFYGNEYEKLETENNSIINSFDQINNINEKSFTLSNKVELSHKWSVDAGYELNEKKVNLVVPEPILIDQELIINPNETAVFHTIFQTANYTSNKLRINAGNRSSFYLQQNKWFHSPRATIEFKLGEALKLKSDYGLYHQFISQLNNFDDRQIIPDNPLWILNFENAQLSQRARKISFGFSIDKNGWLIDLDAYRNQIDGISTFSPSRRFIANLYGFSQGQSSVNGIDVLIKKQFGAFKTSTNYTLSKAEYTFNEISSQSFFAPNDIRHNLRIMNTYDFKNVHLGLQANYHSGLPYSSPNLSFNSEDPNAEHPFQYFIEYGELTNARLPYYFRLDMSIAYKHSFKKRNQSSLDLSFTLINLLNRENIFDREYYIDFKETSESYRLANVDRVLLSKTPLLLIRYYW